MQLIGLVTGAVIALLLSSAQTNEYIEQEPLELPKRHIELRTALPRHPDEEKIEKYICVRGSGYCGTEFTDRVIWWADTFDVSGYLIVAIGVWESGLTPAWGSLCTFGYDSCRTRFSSIDTEIFVIAQTLAKYGGTDYDKYSIWRTGSTGDTDWRTTRVLDTARQIKGL
jgi:hypothetical protein